MDVKRKYQWLLIIFVIWPIIDILLSLFKINLPLIRYTIYTVGTFQIFRLYQNSSKSVAELKNLPKLLLYFALIWLILRFLVSFLEIFNEYRNYINFKNLLSGELILFFSFYIANIRMPLQYFKLFLKTGYILAILFLIIGIPLFPFFTSNILNGAEIFVRNFYLGCIFLLLLFPYQRTKVNIIVALGLLISILMMLLIARRNVVLYLVASLFFLSLVILFSNSQIFIKRKPIIIAGSLIVGFSALLFVMVAQFNFDLFFERTETGMDSREGILIDFQKDFNAQPSDWLTGRGPFGSFYSKLLGNKNNRQRTLIENGYFYTILKQGFFFLIPFILVSITAIINGFFCSKNHLSKASAILIIVNLIDMVGFGLPFLGLKYLNLLIAFGFCFSPTIRNMNDFEIRKIIRL